MSVSSQKGELSVIRPDVFTDRLWVRRSFSDSCCVYWRGHPFEDVSEDLRRILLGGGQDLALQLGSVLSGLRGNFAVVAQAPGVSFAAVDQSRSIPLFMARTPHGWQLDDQALRLQKFSKLGSRDVDPVAHLEIAMSGCTIGSKTLYRGLEGLLPGELVLFQRGREPERSRYFMFRPWKVEQQTEQVLQRACKDVTLDVFERMFKSIEGRPIIVPLSAGYDSRLVVALAKHMGHRDIHCFTYGRAGNFEAETSRAICERLNVRWRFVPMTVSVMRRFFASSLYREYLRFADTCHSTPFVQDVAALDRLLNDNALPKDGVIVNGQSGDFITGNHIPAALARMAADKSPGKKRRCILDRYGAKHFSLWQSLRTPDNVETVETALWQEIETDGAVNDAQGYEYGLYEAAEFQDRQSKYVISGQRSYDLLGLDWRLPLWDASYMNFWQSVPLEHKFGQKLYKETIHAANWSDVWDQLPINRKTIRPLSVVPVRWGAKMLHAPFGRESWHQFERKYFQYWMEVTCHTAAVPYRTWVADKRGARNTMSWMTENFLQRHGLPLDPQEVCSK